MGVRLNLKGCYHMTGWFLWSHNGRPAGWFEIQAVTRENASGRERCRAPANLSSQGCICTESDHKFIEYNKLFIYFFITLCFCCLAGRSLGQPEDSVSHIFSISGGWLGVTIGWSDLALFCDL